MLLLLFHISGTFYIWTIKEWKSELSFYLEQPYISNEHVPKLHFSFWWTLLLYLNQITIIATHRLGIKICSGIDNIQEGTSAEAFSLP